MKELITVSLPTDVAIDITPEAIQLRDETVLALAAVKDITTAEGQQEAVELASKAQKMVKQTEEARKLVKAPVIELGKRIDGVASTFTEALSEQINRIAKLVSRFQEQEAERVRLAEEDRQRKIQEAQQKADAAIAEASKLSQSATTEAEAAAAASAELHAVALQEQEREVILAPEVAPIKASGAATQKVLCYEVENIAEVFKARPELCKIEIKASAVKSTCVPEVPVPGLKLWWDTKTVIRSR